MNERNLTKMKIHYMWRGDPLTPKSLKELSSELEIFGYESVLLPFHSSNSDYLIKSAAALIPGNKLKYMIALRPYHISPQFCSMIAEAYNQIDPDRLIFNWIAGDFHTRLDEPDTELDVFLESEPIDTIQKRTTFLRNFVKQYKSYPILSNRPEMVFSGFSDYTLDTVKIFDGISLCMIDDYRSNINKFEGIKKRIVSVNSIVLDDDIEKYKEKIFSVNPRSLNTTIIGNKESVKKQILELKNEGITDVLLWTGRPEVMQSRDPLNHKNDILVNELVKEILKGDSHV